MGKGMEKAKNVMVLMMYYLVAYLKEIKDGKEKVMIPVINLIGILL